MLKLFSLKKAYITDVPTNADFMKHAIVPLDLQSGYDYCVVRNHVADRDDTGGTSHHSSRPYSVSNFTFARFYRNAQCNNLEDALAAIKYGSRKWINSSISSLPSLERENFQSYFIPFNCDLPFLSMPEACTVMNKYSHIFTIGDSLTRHVRQALLIILRRDLILGGIESSNKYGIQNPYNCRCDGQFSEHSSCRQNDDFFNALRPRDLSLCSELQDNEQFFFVDFLNWTEIDCESQTNKGILLVMQGGGHFGSGVNHTLTSFVKPIISHQKFSECVTLNKLKVVWIAYGSQSRSLDSRYPHQSRENALLFNEQMSLAIQETIPKITIIDWWNLTLDSQTSDGFHYLTDVNLLKGMHFLNIINLLV
jgi:hypothetical protein